MNIQIKEFAEYTGVSVRTLHYYDEIGLLKPAWVDPQSGYRYYDDESLLRMQEILFYKELDVPLKRVLELLSSPGYNKNVVLREQRQLLELKKQRLERLISAIDGAMKGENIMSAFDNHEFEQYKAEVQEKWGKTDAYKEHSEKTKGYSKANWKNAADGMNEIFAAFAAYMNSGAAADSAEAKRLVKCLQDHITANFYTCTPEILSGLGQMYVADQRFMENIDKNGAGTAEFVSRAIAAYCQK